MRNKEQGFTLLEIASTLIIVGIIGLAVTGSLTRIVQDFVAARAVAERMPVVDAALSVVRRGLASEDRADRVRFQETDGYLRMRTGSTEVTLLRDARIKEGEDFCFRETEHELKLVSDEAKEKLGSLNLNVYEMSALEKAVWRDVTVTVRISEELPLLDFPISVGR